AFDSDAPDVVNKNLIELQSNDEVDKRIDSICILRKGVIINKDQLGNFSALPSQGSISIASLTTKPLLFFYVLISHLLNQACMFEDFNVIEYTKEISF
ncbi:MAG: hypothetical protein JXA60_11550, partial [Candidatus Coatesbacteria bacterium]|nr:hypothetical protein [Candidatus Coatesbacteria bacterium]